MSSEEIPTGDLKPARRRGRGPGVNRPPKRPPRSVAELIRSANPEERETATRQAMELLAYWRGLAGSKDVASRIGIRRNGVYLLQQRALAGMVAGLLPAPRGRRRTDPAGKSRDDEMTSLKKEAEKLRKERDAFAGLVRLLRNLPGASRTSEAKGHARAKKANGTDGKTPDRKVDHGGSTEAGTTRRRHDEQARRRSNAEELGRGAKKGAEG